MSVNADRRQTASNSERPLRVGAYRMKSSGSTYVLRYTVSTGREVVSISNGYESRSIGADVWRFNK